MIFGLGQTVSVPTLTMPSASALTPLQIAGQACMTTSGSAGSGEALQAIQAIGTLNQTYAAANSGAPIAIDNPQVLSIIASVPAGCQAWVNAYLAQAVTQGTLTAASTAASSTSSATGIPTEYLVLGGIAIAAVLCLMTFH